ncbi:MAG: hypothetical protein G01um101433_58 [Parcubacteria group bacterium Gr01-1014_33]|nr:MAG: hypothetical protein G01um101433_58 [Parcubacteria group bacterium Gr01-1014_33]
MITLHENETILAVVHKHWFSLLRQMVIYAIPFLLLAFLLFFASALPFGLDFEAILPFSQFLSALTLFILILVLFLAWTDYYLDMWIISNERIIDVEQEGLFSREVADIPLSHVQDVTIEITGPIQTFLRFGTIRIQTAGEREFTIDEIPELNRIKELVLAKTPSHDHFPHM